MDLPGFSASASLYQIEGHAQREAARVGIRGHNEVVAQSKADQYSMANAQHVRDVLGFGEVRCDWFTYCEGNHPNQHCGIRRVCYWWPW